MPKFDEIVSLGHRCTSQIAINYVSNNSNCIGETSPFSWVNNFNANNIHQVIETNFTTYLSNIEKEPYHLDINLPLKSSHGFGHYDLSDKRVQESFERKIHRFMNTLNNDNRNILFVYINEDFLYNEDYRLYDDRIYEDLKILHDFIENRYPKLKFKLFNIAFNEKDNYKNITNVYYKPKKIISKKDWHENMSIRSNLENEFRGDCGQLLLRFIQ